MKAISFLGPTDYEETQYSFLDRNCSTKFFAEALPKFFPDLSEILVFVTPRVAQHQNLADLQTRLGDIIVPIPIPDGRSEVDLWQIFDALTDSIDDGEEVVFDITNSYRSLPFLVFLAAAYLRSVRGVQVKGIIYGAFEAETEGVTPVFDLTPFVALLDWLTASDQFIQTGDARRLASLIRAEDLIGRSEEQAAAALSRISLSTFLCNPFELMQEAGQLAAHLKPSDEDSLRLPRPFELIRDRVSSTFSPFGADYETSPLQGLRAKYRLILWYHENNHMIQAMTLAREWLVSAVAYRLVDKIDLHASVRRTFEHAVSGIAMVGRERRDPETDEMITFTESDLNEYGRRIYDEWPEADDIGRLWNQLTPIRNELNHAFHKQGSMRLDKLVRKTTETVVPMLTSLAQKWQLDETETS